MSFLKPAEKVDWSKYDIFRRENGSNTGLRKYIEIVTMHLLKEALH